WWVAMRPFAEFTGGLVSTTSKKQANESQAPEIALASQCRRDTPTLGMGARGAATPVSTLPDPHAVARVFTEAARELGFSRIGITPVGAVDRHKLYSAWLEHGYAGEMSYPARDAEPRRDPAALLQSARTVVTVALSYAHPDPGDGATDPLFPG